MLDAIADSFSPVKHGGLRESSAAISPRHAFLSPRKIKNEIDVDLRVFVFAMCADEHRDDASRL
jgi:hypothetical protein